MPLLVLLFSAYVFAAIPSMIMSNTRALYIVDGDSLSLQMRIKGIDTPEKTQKCRKNANSIIDCGQISKEYLQGLLDNVPGKLLIKPIATDYYHRILVNVYKGSVNIGEMMVSEGMAVAYGMQYQAQEQQARKFKKGFWGYIKPPLNPKKWRKKHPRKSKY